MYWASNRQSAEPIVLEPCVLLLQTTQPRVNHLPPGVNATPPFDVNDTAIEISGIAPSAGTLLASKIWMNCELPFVLVKLTPITRHWPLKTTRLEASAGLKALSGSISGNPYGYHCGNASP